MEKQDGNGMMAGVQPGTNFAAIDIGSNAVRLLIKQLEDVSGPRFSKSLLVRVPLRLGFDVFSEGSIPEGKRKQLVRLMKAYRHLMKIYRVADYRACATSAMRDAANGCEIIRAVEKATGIRIEIIDGQEEARLVYGNHIEQAGRRKGNWMYVDVGGGSTEINLIASGSLVCSRSYNIGTVRLLNEAVAESEWMRLRGDLADLTRSYPGISIIGSGGNINKLIKLVEYRDKRYPKMTVSSLKSLYAKLKDMSVAERMQVYSLKPDRADVIEPAARIFLTISDITGAEQIYVPVIGLADGIIDDLYSRYAAAGETAPVDDPRHDGVASRGLRDE